MDEEGISMAEFKDAFEKGNMFASGIGEFPVSSIRVIYQNCETDE